MKKKKIIVYIDFSKLLSHILVFNSTFLPLLATILNLL